MDTLKMSYYQVLCVCKKPKPVTATIEVTSIAGGKLYKSRQEVYPYCGKCGNVLSAEQMRKHGFYKKDSHA